MHLDLHLHTASSEICWSRHPDYGKLIMPAAELALTHLPLPPPLPPHVRRGQKTRAGQSGLMSAAQEPHHGDHHLRHRYCCSSPARVALFVVGKSIATAAACSSLGGNCHYWVRRTEIAAEGQR
jgi:hypothetical protein